jgi:hypothetical protein
VYRTKTVTTTERVQIVQVPQEVSEEDNERLRQMTVSPTGEASRTVFSTTTTLEEGGTSVIGGVSASGVPIHSGIHYVPQSRQTTTVVTTTTTTYKLVESEADGSDLDEMDPTLTLDIPICTSPLRETGYVIVSGPSSSPLSTLTTEEETTASRTSMSDARPESLHSPEGWEEVFNLDKLQESLQGFSSSAQSQSTDEEPTEEDHDFVHLYKDGREYLIFSSERYVGPLVPTNRENEIADIPIFEYVEICRPNDNNTYGGYPSVEA